MFEYCYNSTNFKNFIFFGECINNTYVKCHHLAKHDQNFLYFENCSQFKYINYIFTSFVILYLLYVFYTTFILYKQVQNSKQNVLLIKIIVIAMIIDLINQIIFLITDQTSYIFFFLFALTIICQGGVFIIFFQRLLKIESKILLSKDDFNFIKKFKLVLSSSGTTGSLPYFAFGIAFIYKYDNIDLFNTIVSSIYLYASCLAILAFFQVNFVVKRVESIISNIILSDENQVSTYNNNNSNNSSKNTINNSKISNDSNKKDNSTSTDSANFENLDFKEKCIVLLDALTILNKNLKIYWIIVIPFDILVIIGYFGFGQAPFVDFIILYTQTSNFVLFGATLQFIENSFNKTKNKKKQSKLFNNQKNKHFSLSTSKKQIDNTSNIASIDSVIPASDNSTFTNSATVIDVNSN